MAAAEVEPDDLEGVEDFDAWLKDEEAKRKPKLVRIYGRVIEAPTDMPLGLSISIETSTSANLEEVQQLVGALYGADALDHWIESGCKLRGFQVLLAYGYLHASGRDVTFDEAAELVRNAEAESAGSKATAAAGKARRKPAAPKQRSRK